MRAGAGSSFLDPTQTTLDLADQLAQRVRVGAAAVADVGAQHRQLGLQLSDEAARLLGLGIAGALLLELSPQPLDRRRDRLARSVADALTQPLDVLAQRRRIVALDALAQPFQLVAQLAVGGSLLQLGAQLLDLVAQFVAGGLLLDLAAQLLHFASQLLCPAALELLPEQRELAGQVRGGCLVEPLAAARPPLRVVA